ncbi:MAG: glycoside hydrolase family 18 protein [Terracidiphilus sp.]
MPPETTSRIQLFEASPQVLSKLSLLLLALLSCSPASFAAAPAPKPVIVAYVFPENQVIHPGDIAAQKITRINYAFANIRNGRIVNGFTNDDQNLAALVALKQPNPSLTVLVSVGGWQWSGGFSEMALNEKTRAVFISSVADFVDRHQLDGLDVDWEFPGQAGSTKHFRAVDKQNYTLLLKELRARFDQLEKQFHRPLYLTIATGASSEFLEHTEMAQVQKYVDTVNLMAYDYYEPGSEPITGHHAPLFTNPSDPDKVSADNSVREYEQAGVQPEKIVLGVPFYGHVWGGVGPASHGLYQHGKGIPNARALYGNSPETMQKNGFIRYWDPTSSVPYLYNPQKKVFVSYEDSESLALKCKYVLDHKLRGIMFWDYEADSTGALLNAVNTGLHKNPGTF